MPRCAAFVACIRCGAKPGELCSSSHGRKLVTWKSDVHACRRDAYTEMLKRTGENRKRKARVITIEDEEVE